MNRSFEMELVNLAIEQDKFDNAFNTIFAMSKNHASIWAEQKRDLTKKLEILGDQNETSTNTASA